jgi:hypothetical protein
VVLVINFRKGKMYVDELVPRTINRSLWRLLSFLYLLWTVWPDWTTFLTLGKLLWKGKSQNLFKENIKLMNYCKTLTIFNKSTAQWVNNIAQTFQYFLVTLALNDKRRQQIVDLGLTLGDMDKTFFLQKRKKTLFRTSSRSQSYIRLLNLQLVG